MQTIGKFSYRRTGFIRTKTCFLLTFLFASLVSAEAIPKLDTPSMAASQIISASASPNRVPQFSVDPTWPTFPDTWLIGQVSGLAVDKQDNIWLLQRPNSLSRIDLGLAQSPPTALCCEPAPHVIQLSPQGKVMTAWGGPEITPTIDGQNQWPALVHGLHVDDKNTIWLGGNGSGDHQVLNFTATGKFIQAIGQRGKTGGNHSQGYLGNPADIATDNTTNKVLIADGYVNKRIVAFDADDHHFDQYWGAYGADPDTATRQGDFDVSQATANAATNSTEANTFGDIIHCVTQSSDGRIYVCDRKNNRLQVFRFDAAGKIQFERNLIIAGDTGGVGSATDVAFSPDNKYLYVADMMNGRIWILWHDTYEILGSFGRPGRYPGQFTWLHSVVTDSLGNIYTSEVNTGRRVQKFTLTGFAPQAQ
jgi:DNA-binding beta-propeller fold protein YncE